MLYQIRLDVEIDVTYDMKVINDKVQKFIDELEAIGLEVQTPLSLAIDQLEVD